MGKAERLRFCKGDMVAVTAVLVLALAVLLCFLPGQEGSSGKAVIYLNGEPIKTVDLTEDQIITVSDRYHNVIRVADGAIFFAESDCPGQDCVHSGSIRTSGRVLVCLPNAVEIRVISHEADVDFVVG